jgi:hypothetical protein
MTEPAFIAALLTLLHEMREDWDEHTIAGAVSAALTSGREPGWIAESFIRMARDKTSQPRDFAEAMRNPLHRAEPQPDTYARGLAAARSAAGIRP